MHANFLGSEQGRERWRLYLEGPMKDTQHISASETLCLLPGQQNFRGAPKSWIPRFLLSKECHLLVLVVLVLPSCYYGATQRLNIGLVWGPVYCKTVVLRHMVLWKPQVPSEAQLPAWVSIVTQVQITPRFWTACTVSLKQKWQCSCMKLPISTGVKQSSGMSTLMCTGTSLGGKSSTKMAGLGQIFT